MKLILRAWLPDKEKMLHHDEISLTDGRVFERIYDERSGIMNSFARDNAVLMVYTGLADKKGKSVYEGDIIEFYHIDNSEDTAEIAPVVWFGNSEWNYPAFDLDGRYFKEHYFEGNALSEILSSGSHHCVVRGNIYQHPELLERK